MFFGEPKKKKKKKKKPSEVCTKKPPKRGSSVDLKIAENNVISIKILKSIILRCFWECVTT